MKDTEEATSKLRAWLEQMSNPSIDPWPHWQPDTRAGSSVALGERITIDPTYDHADTLQYSYSGKRNADGLFDVYGTVTYENGDIVTSEYQDGIKQGEALIISPRKNLARLVGSYVNDRLEGKGKIVSNETAVTDCFFLDGCIDGPVRRFTMKKFREFRQQLDFVGTYKKGKPSGMCYEYREGGGWMVGQVDGNGEFTGEEALAYLYPDLRTAFVGSFVQGKMVGAKKTELVDVILDPSTHIMTPVFAAQPHHQEEPDIRYSKATKDNIGDLPLVTDPYEDRTVEVRKSKVDGGGEGLFAKVDLPKGTIVAFYNGIRLPYRVGGPKDEWLDCLRHL